MSTSSLCIASFGRGRLIWLTFLFCLVLNPFDGHAQKPTNLLDTLITINFNNQRLKDALEQMEIQTHITFSYKSDLLKEDRIINQYFVKEPLESIIVKLIDDATISFNNLGRQVYFYIPKNTKFVPIRQEVVKTVEVPVYRDVIKTDTILLMRVDTVFQIKLVPDTVVIRESMFIGDFDTKENYSFSTFLNQSAIIPGYKLNDENYADIFNDLKDAESNGSITRLGVIGTMHSKKVFFFYGIRIVGKKK